MANIIGEAMLIDKKIICFNPAVILSSSFANKTIAAHIFSCKRNNIDLLIFLHNSPNFGQWCHETGVS
jgi:hypothetical protein